MSDAETHFRKLERLYQQAPINQQQEAPSMEVEDGWTRVKMMANPSQYHGGGAVHGSVLFRLMDDAAFFAANSKVLDAMVLTVQFEVHYGRPVREGKMTAIGELRTPGRHLLVASATVYDAKDREIAFGTGTFAKSSLPVE
jgi:uncharacterized protein (TIGR00369 family)